MISTALLIAAFVLFVLAASGWPTSKYNLVACGLAVYVLAQLVPVFSH